MAEYQRINVNGSANSSLIDDSKGKTQFIQNADGSYPNTWGNVLLIYVLLLCLYVFSAGYFALNLWLLFLNTVTVSWVYAGIGFSYVVIILIAIYFGQAMRNALEKKFMAEALAKHNEAAGHSNEGYMDGRGAATVL